MKVTIYRNPLVDGSERKTFSVDEWSTNSPGMVISNLKCQLLIAQALWPEELKGYTIGGLNRLYTETVKKSK